MKSYNEILDQLRTKYIERTGLEPDDASDIGIRLKVLAGELLSAYAELEWTKNQMFPDTATGEYLDRHAFQRGISRQNGIKATGDVEFFIPFTRSYDVVVPIGTVISTAGNDPVRFQTTTAATIRAGQTGGGAEIEALEPGSNGNVSPRAISVIVTPVSGVTSVKNDYRTVGGTDSESDDSLRRRILDSFVNISNGTNKEYYRKTALSVDGVTAAGVIPKLRGPGTVDVFIASSDGAPTSLLIQTVANKLSGAREINVDVQVSAMHFVPVDVTMAMKVKSGYGFNAVKSGCEAAIERYFSLVGGGETVYLSDIGEAVAHVEGVENYTFISPFMNDTEIPENSTAVCGVITITERD